MDKNRVPLNEDKLDAVSGGTNVNLPDWAHDYVNWLNTCPHCRANGVDRIRGKVTHFSYIQTDIDYRFSVSYECPAGHTWKCEGNGDDS